MITRMLTVKGPPGAVDPTHGVAAATLVKSFRRMHGFLGGIILVDVGASCVRTIGFWQDEEAIASSDQRAETMGTNLSRALFGAHGSYHLQTFEVIAIDPPPAVAFPNWDPSNAGPEI